MHANLQTLLFLAIALLLIAVLIERIALKRERRQTRIFKTYAPYLFMTEVPRHGSGRGRRHMDTKKNYVQRARAGLPDLQSLQGMASGMSSAERERLSVALGPGQVEALRNAMAQRAEGILKRDEIRTRGTLHLDKIETAGLLIPAASQAVGHILIELAEIEKDIMAQLPPHHQVIFQANQAQLAEHVLAEASLGTSGFGFNVKELYLSALHALTQETGKSETVKSDPGRSQQQKANDQDLPLKESTNSNGNHSRKDRF